MITIKKCEENQLDSLHKIAIQTYNDTYQYLWSDNGTWYLNEFYQKESFKKELSQPDIFYFLVYDEDKIIGYFKIMNIALDPYPEEQCTEIDKLYLLKDYGGKGIGKTIMEFIFDFSKKQKRSVLWLKAMESSPAKSFYEKSGFIETDKANLNFPTIREEHRLILTMVKEI
ncbi:ribosomal protein S18 acetylase RimI-like enzyme [Flavobacterium chryseum]|uniref:GNAT family N-acetyltransferase n=1 Tax=Flavobacterium sp. P3160 TaxID=2512113 RepID=UPI00105D232A|nr:GNAT family N-acetyltransferase [Flavobacterium sp. P3160]TDO71356.1 ribosomal protein S18 acetylase RimI-like enzyme [Flavobacterium sp. P3160]